MKQRCSLCSAIQLKKSHEAGAVNIANDDAGSRTAERGNSVGSSAFEASLVLKSANGGKDPERKQLVEGVDLPRYSNAC
jgi:hypothetical protein